MQLIYAEPHGEDPRVTIITRGGIVTEENRMTQGNTTQFNSPGRGNFNPHGGSEEEEEEEVWVEFEDKSSITTVCSQDTYQGTSRTLVPLAATATHLNMLLRIVQHC